MMTDIKLRFADVAEYEAAAPWTTRDAETGELLTYPGGEGCSVVAGVTVVTVPGVYDPETLAEITPPVLAPGFHVDVRLVDRDVPEELTPFLVAPAISAHEFAS